METLKQVIEQAKMVFRHMTRPQKLSLMLVTISMLICLFVVFFWSMKPDYVVLYSSLSIQDAGEIQEELSSLDVPYEITGTTIKVPAKTVYETRLKLANQGLPKAQGVGFELFDKIKVGQTDYIQRLNFQRALEGELARTIDSLKPIDYSRVHLVIPEESIFTDQAKQASASIVLTLRSGNSLDKNSVEAIKHLVASSVEGLELENITIIDSQGDMLSSGSDANELLSGMTASQLEIQRGVERYLEQKASSLLLGFLGPDKAIVRVSADLDFSQKEKTEEKYNPEEQIARSENRIEETAKGSEGSDNSVEKTITNYEIGRTVEHMIGATGEVERISVAVVLDGVYKTTDQGERIYAERAPAEIESIKKIIINALGLSEKRGDQIEVRNIAFDKSYLDDQARERQRADRISLVFNIAAYWPWLIVLILFIFMYRIFKNVMSQASQMKVAIPKFMMQGKGGGIPGVMTDEEAEEHVGRYDTMGLELPHTTKLEKEVVKLASQSPDTIARIIRTWVEEKEGD